MRLLSSGILGKGCAALAVVLFATGIAGAELLKIECPKSVKATRPPVMFDHDAHNEKAGIDDCSECHHGARDGKIERNDPSEGTPCIDCHALKAPSGTTPYMRAFHRQCIVCHKKTNNGPTACGECHR